MKTYSGINVSQGYHLACTQQQATSHRHHSNNRLDWQASDAATSQHPRPPPETVKTHQIKHTELKRTKMMPRKGTDILKQKSKQWYTLNEKNKYDA